MTIRNLGLYVTSIVVQLPTGITDNAEGGSADGLTAVTVPCRVKIAGQRSSGQVLNAFPGTDSGYTLLLGWCGTEADPTNNTFPNSLRGWPEFPTGEMTLNGIAGKVEFQVQPFAVADAIDKIGERFVARWRPF